MPDANFLVDNLGSQWGIIVNQVLLKNVNLIDRIDKLNQAIQQMANNEQVLIDRIRDLENELKEKTSLKEVLTRP